MTNLVDEACSGKQHCQLPVLNLEGRDDLSPCPVGLQMYLDAVYSCQAGMIFVMVLTNTIDSANS